ncbi:histone deacetylase family protein [Cobetia marina]
MERGPARAQRAGGGRHADHRARSPHARPGLQYRRGTHHAHPEAASGYCLLNDIGVAAHQALEDGVTRVLIVDLDVHQGDGTALIFADEPRVFTLSLHAESNFPARKQKSDLDVPLPKGMGDEDYLAVLERTLEAVLTRVQPELVIFDAGVDPHAADRLGHLELSDRGLYRRERHVIQRCREAGAAVACVIGGGYDRDIEALAWRHSQLHRAALDVWREAHGQPACSGRRTEPCQPPPERRRPPSSMAGVCVQPRGVA